MYYIIQEYSGDRDNPPDKTDAPVRSVAFDDIGLCSRLSRIIHANKDLDMFDYRYASDILMGEEINMEGDDDD